MKTALLSFDSRQICYNLNVSNVKGQRLVAGEWPSSAWLGSDWTAVMRVSHYDFIARMISIGLEIRKRTIVGKNTKIFVTQDRILVYVQK